MYTAQEIEAPEPTPAPDYAVLHWLVAATFVVILNETIMINAIPRLMADFDGRRQRCPVALDRVHAHDGGRHPGDRLVPPARDHPLRLRPGHGRVLHRHAARRRGVDLPGAARRAGHPGQRNRRDDAAADDDPDGRRARARPGPGDGQRHPRHLGRAGARPGGLRRRPAVAVVALDLPRRAADRGRHRRVRPASPAQRRRAGRRKHRLAERRDRRAGFRQPGLRPQRGRRRRATTPAAYVALVVGCRRRRLVRLAPAGAPAQRPAAARPAHPEAAGLLGLARRDGDGFHGHARAR